MCTVTFIARRNGYALGMNRDERLMRVPGLPPRLRRINGRRALFPSEPNGGTWIGVNDAGATFALINWYAVAARIRENPSSRGQVVKWSLPADSPNAVERIFDGLPLSRTNPFRLIGVFLAERHVVEWRWDLQLLERRAHSWSTNTWISSGFDEPGAQQARSKAFRKAMCQPTVSSLDWLRRLHRSHVPERGPYSHCMHRLDAASVSYTEVAVTRRTATMRYMAGPPCCTPLSKALSL